MINTHSFFSSRTGANGAPMYTLNEIAQAVWAGSTAMPQAVADAVWANPTRRLSATGVKDIAVAQAKFGYQTDTVNMQLVQLDETGVEVCRFNCYDINGLPSLTSIKRMVAVNA